MGFFKYQRLDRKFRSLTKNSPSISQDIMGLIFVGETIDMRCKQ